jgi:hypothetical protein
MRLLTTDIGLMTLASLQQMVELNRKKADDSHACALYFD